MTPAAIREHIETADNNLDKALAAAVLQPETLVPAIMNIMAKAAKGTYLLPKQSNLLFYGLHALAAARLVAVYKPFLDLLHADEEVLERACGVDLTEIAGPILIGLFDGDAEPVFAALAAPHVDGAVKWSLFQALAYLAKTDQVSLDRTVAFLDRFDRDGMAPAGDLAWQGWQDAILYLGLVSFEERLQQAWDGERVAYWRKEDRRDYLERLHHAASHPDNPECFVADGIVEITDPVTYLKDRGYWPEPEPTADTDDPASDVALNPEELNWLEGFLESASVPITTMSLETLDGFFCALVSGPSLVMPSEYMPELWGSKNGPQYDSIEQAQYVHSLLMRHWNTIAVRLNAHHAHDPLFVNGDPDWGGFAWATGFLVGLDLRRDEWRPLVQDERRGDFITAILSLAADGTQATSEMPDAKTRLRLLKMLPGILIAIHSYWRNPLESRPVPARSEKIGRNDPCPCGSGRKYKRCCGGNQQSTV